MRTDLRRVLQHLRCETGGLSDGQLLVRFIASRDETAFAALVRRHGRMVLAVCRRVLRNPHDAEDAFQTTFLVLARKAASVVKRESVGSWLYGVAYRTALGAAASLARRRATELQVEELPHRTCEPDETFDLRPLLDRELSLLPEKYRAAVVLCDLEGHSRKEASRQLRIPEGTLSSRLSTAHKLLAKRLARSGLALAACGVSAALAQSRASAGIPSALIRHVAKAATILGAGSTPAFFLVMKGAIHMMLATKWWPVIVAAAVAGTLGVIGMSLRPGDNSGSAQAAPPKQESELDALRKEVELLKNTLQIVVDKNRDLERELASLRGQGSKGGAPTPGGTSSDSLLRPGSPSGTPQNRGGVDAKPAAPGATPLDVPARPGARPVEGDRAPLLPGANDPFDPNNNFRNGRPVTPNVPAAGVSQDVIDDLQAALKVLRDGKGGRSAGDTEKLIQNLEAVLKGLREAKGATDPRRE